MSSETDGDARGPVQRELHGIYIAASRTFVATLTLAIAFTVLAYLISVPMVAPSLAGFIEWWEPRRSSWQTGDMLAISFSVIVPSVLSIVLDANSPEIARSPRRQAIFEAARNVLFWGLVVSAVLAFLAFANAIASADVAGTVLSLGVAGACSVLAQTMPPQGAERYMLLKAAKRRQALVLETQEDALARAERQAKGITKCFASHPQLAFWTMLLVVTLVTGLMPALVVWLRYYGWRYPRWAAEILAFTLVFGLVGLCVFVSFAYARARSALGGRRFALVILLFPGLSLVVLLYSMIGANSEQRLAYDLLFFAIVAAGFAGWVLSITLPGTLVKLDWLRGVSEIVQDRVEFLSQQ